MTSLRHLWYMLKRQVNVRSFLLEKNDYGVKNSELYCLSPAPLPGRPRIPSFCAGEE